jgi:hypothetical protein
VSSDNLTASQKIDRIYEHLGGGSPSNVAAQIDDIHKAVQDGDATVMAKVVEVNSRLSTVEKWVERVKGAASLGTFVLGPGIIIAVIALVVTISIR